MTGIRLLVVCCVLLGYSSARHVIKTLSVNNGGGWGNWNQEHFCPPGKFAVGYQLKIEGNQGGGDDTALNGIQLICNGGATITSGVGPWGYWGSQSHCRWGGSLVAFSLQVESSQGSKNDDTAANFVKFLCRDNGSGNTEVNVVPPGEGLWGSYGGWSQTCDRGSAICGLSTKVEEPQGSGDDTALNDVRFFCCDD